MSTQSYYVPHQSRWPILASISLFLMAIGAGGYINSLGSEEGSGLSGFSLLIGSLFLAAILVGWFRNVIKESMARHVQRADGQVFPLGHELVHLL